MAVAAYDYGGYVGEGAAALYTGDYSHLGDGDGPTDITDRGGVRGPKKKKQKRKRGQARQQGDRAKESDSLEDAQDQREGLDRDIDRRRDEDFDDGTPGPKDDTKNKKTEQNEQNRFDRIRSIDDIDDVD